MKISDNLTLSAINYANQGNSIIGIRGSGKTYTATKIAEEIIKSGIPIIAFDPTGVWQNLRFGTNGKAGFPVVVAGGFHGDIALSEDNAVQIVEAALKHNISLVIDLQGTATSNKSKWMRIVSDCVEFLMGNNQQYGLRHIFIEEAAEFVPQKPSPGGALVYSRIESMARIGRNFGLGYTLINQRAEEIAKAVFEISELVFVHRQSGKNSLNSIKDWLNVRGQADANIVQTLPKLESGQCWAIDNTQEVLINVLEKDTFHPDPKKGLNAAAAPVTATNADLLSFIQGFKGTEPTPANAKKVKETVAEITNYDEAIKELRARLDRLEKILFVPKVEVKKVAYAGVLKRAIATPSPVTGKTGASRMLIAAAMFPKGITKVRMGTIADMSPTSGSFGTYLSTLKREDLITVENGHVKVTAKGKEQAGAFKAYPKKWSDRVVFWCDLIGGNSGAARILTYLAACHPNYATKATVGAQVGMSHTSGSFGTYLSTLKRHDLITVSGGNLKAADELFN